jgi:hypothetical protein
MNPIPDSEIPEPGDPPEPIDPELERLLTWFVRSKRIAWTFGADEAYVRPQYASDKPGTTSGVIFIKNGKVWRHNP